MIHFAPFQDEMEHRAFCLEGDVPFEEASVGFKIFSENEKLGLCQIKVVDSAAYVLSLCAIRGRVPAETLAEVLRSVMTFLQRLEICSVIYPIQKDEDRKIAERQGFDQVSDTLYVYDFLGKEKEENREDCDCGHCHSDERRDMGS